MNFNPSSLVANDPTITLYQLLREILSRGGRRQSQVALPFVSATLRVPTLNSPLSLP